MAGFVEELNNLPKNYCGKCHFYFNEDNCPLCNSEPNEAQESNSI